MKFIFIGVGLLLLNVYSYGQSVEERCILFAYLLQPTGMPRIGYMPPDAGGRMGSIAIGLNRADYFFKYGDASIKTNLYTYCDLFAEYVIRDSARFFKDASISVYDLKGQYQDGQFIKMSRLDSTFQNLGRVGIIEESLPVPCILNFLELDKSQSRYELQLYIQGKDWALKTDIAALDLYASAAACLIYDILAKRKLDKYPKITIRTINTTSKDVIHEKSFDTNTIKELVPLVVRNIRAINH
jgi:hypothetical protein